LNELVVCFFEKDPKYVDDNAVVFNFTPVPSAVQDFKNKEMNMDQNPGNENWDNDQNNQAGDDNQNNQAGDDNQNNQAWDGNQNNQGWDDNQNNQAWDNNQNNQALDENQNYPAWDQNQNYEVVDPYQNVGNRVNAGEVENGNLVRISCGWKPTHVTSVFSLRTSVSSVFSH
jgi:hypothetical protein